MLELFVDIILHNCKSLLYLVIEPLCRVCTAANWYSHLVCRCEYLLTRKVFNAFHYPYALNEWWSTLMTEVKSFKEALCIYQRDKGYCEKDWIVSGGYCETTCGRCPCPDPCRCTDVPPPGENSNCADLVMIFDAAGIQSSLDGPILLVLGLFGGQYPFQWIPISCASFIPSGHESSR